MLNSTENDFSNKESLPPLLYYHDLINYGFEKEEEHYGTIS